MAGKNRPQAETLSGSPQPNFTNYAPKTIKAKRAPTTGDTGYDLGQTWLDTVGDDYYVLSDVSAGVATWDLLGTNTGPLNTLTADSGGAISPSAGNINILGTANQITTAGAGSTITYSLPSAIVTPGSLTTTTNLAVGTSATVGTTLSVTGASTFAGTTIVGTANINASGAAATAIATGGTGTLALGNATGNTTLTGSFSTLTAAGTFVIGTSAQTGTTTVVSSTAANSVLIQNGINVAAQITSINNGATAADSTVNILSGIGTAGAGVLSMANNTRVTTIDLGNIAPAAARTTSIAGGNSAQNDTVTIFGGAPSANTQTFNLFSGNASGGTQVANVFSGTNAATLNLATGGTGVKTIHIGDGAAANLITIGSTTGAATTTIQAGSGAINLTGNVNLTSVATKISLNGGAVTDFIGQATLTNGTVTVANTNIATADRIFVTRSAKNGSTAFGEFETTIVNATSFTVRAAKPADTTTETNDASTVDYIIFRQT